jgi:hypothetical protein
VNQSYLTANQTITLSGDVTGSGTTGIAATIANGAVTNAKHANSPANTIKGNNTGTAAAPIDLTGTQTTAMLDVFTTTLKGLAPSSGGGTTNFLRADATWAAPPAAGGAVLYNFLGGLTLSYVNTTTFGIAVGAATSDDNTILMTLTSAYTKTRAAWAVGTGNGALDTGTIAANTWYHIFLIERTDTGVVDVLMSLSPTAPTMPASYTVKRRIGSIRTIAASNLQNFIQVGDLFLLATLVFDAGTGTGSTAGTALSVTTTASLATLSFVPSGVQVIALIGTYITAGANPIQLDLFSADQTVGVGGFLGLWAYASGGAAGADYQLRTDTSGRIKYAGSVALTGTTTVGLWIITKGWTDNRGK